MDNVVKNDIRIVEEPRKPLAMHPKKFAMWLFLASVLMLFAAFTSAYIVRQAEGDWVIFDLPVMFTFTTIVILASSIPVQWAYFAARKNQQNLVVALLGIATVLGIVFLAGQWQGWVQLVDNRVHLVGNPSGSFFYLITGLHGLHIISAIIYLIITLVRAQRGVIHSGNLAPLEMCVTYWHFLGGLWLYLFVFLLLNR
ncbi:MAG: heme-copper oxidase subunit III [Cyclobacteriaceae bacterium]|jgi:cytochrome c oxidase subunit 3